MNRNTFFVAFGNTSMVAITETSKWCITNKKESVYTIPLYLYECNDYSRKIQILPDEKIEDNIIDFIDYARNNFDDNFFILFDESLTYLPNRDMILSLFEDVPNNCVFETKFKNYIDVNTKERP